MTDHLTRAETVIEEMETSLLSPSPNSGNETGNRDDSRL